MNNDKDNNGNNIGSNDGNNSVEKLRAAILQQRLQKLVKAQAPQHAQAPIPVADRGAGLPLSFAQQRLWFLDQLNNAAGAAYHMPAALRLKGTLDQDALHAALNRIVARHESLRTTFVDVDGQAFQRIAADGAMVLTRRDLRHLAGHEQECMASAIAADEAAAPFDLAAGPLIRGQLLRLADDDFLLLITKHHIVSDGWSVGVYVKELVGTVQRLQRRRGRSAAAAGDPICRLRGLAARLVARRRAASPDRLLEECLARRPRLAGAANRPPPPGHPEPCRRQRAGRLVGGAERRPARAEPAPRRHAVHDAAGRLGRPCWRA